MRQKEQRGLYISQKILNIAYNTKYNLLKYFEQYDKQNFLKPKDEIYILGNRFVADDNNLQQVQAKIYDIFERTPWLTYRAGFPELPNQVVGSFVSDTGWGCMVRVGQMLFAQVIKYHQGITDKQQIIKILQLFSDYDRTQPFSIHNIARLARIQYGLKPGDWYNPSQISYILGELHEQYLKQSLKLKFIIFNSGNLFFDTLVQGMLQQDIKCTCQQKQKQKQKQKIKQFICQICNKAKNSVSTIVLSRLGLNSPQKKYLIVLQKLFQSQNCQGVIGGKPEKALYFIGKQNQYFIYLDPHYVHNAGEDVKQTQQTYFCQSFRMCNNSSIDSSVGICFYFRDVSSLNRFHRFITKLKIDYFDDFFIFVADKTPKHIKTHTTKSQFNKEKQQQVFEFL